MKSLYKEYIFIAKSTKSFRPLDLGEEKIDLTNRKDWMGDLEDDGNWYDIRILDEDTTWWKDLSGITKQIPGLKGNEVFDTRIALCLKQHKVKRIWTRDADFKKYSFLQVVSFFK